MIIRRTGTKLLVSKFAFFFIMLMPSFLAYRSDLRMVYNGWHIVQLLIAVFFVLIYVVRHRFDNLTVNCVSLYYAIAIISSVYSGYSVYIIKWDIVADIGVAAGAYLLMKKNQRNFLNVMANILFVYLIINTITMFLYPGGIASGRIGQIVWFLGGKNNILPWILIGGGCLSLDSIERYGIITKRTYLKIALCSIQAFLCDSSTAVTLVVLLWLLYMVNWLFQNPKIVDAVLRGRKIILFAAVGFTAVIFFTQKSNFLQGISAWFGKDITFNGRTAIWGIALQYIANHPLIGAGPVLTFDMGWGVNMTHAHCLYLNVLAHYGVFALLAVIMCVWSALKKTDSIPSTVYYTLFLYLIGSIIEVYSLNSLFLFCVILGCYNSNPPNKQLVYRILNN